MGYTKLSSSIVTSSIWCEDPRTLKVWVMFLALKDAEGFVPGTVPGLANLAGLSIKEFNEAMDVLIAPDEHSRTKDEDGRRLEVIDDGWLVINHYKYRDNFVADEQKARKARNSRDYRSRHRPVTAPSPASGDASPASGDASPRITRASPHTDTDTYTSAATPTVLENDIPPITTNDYLFLKDSFPNQSKRAQGKKKTPDPFIGWFDDFWSAVHKKIQKRNAQTAFKKAVDRVASERGITKADAAAMITAAMTEYAASPAGDPQERSPTHPATWLNSGQYDDDPDTWVENQQLTPGQRRVAASQQAIQDFVQFTTPTIEAKRIGNQADGQ